VLFGNVLNKNHETLLALFIFFEKKEKFYIEGNALYVVWVV
jgi:hypothetical protein